jgi:hypothetical protein
MNICLNLGVEMNKQSEEYRRVSRDSRLIATDIMGLTGWPKQKALDWLKTNNILFQGKTPLEMIVENNSDAVMRHLVFCKMKGYNYI